MPSSSVAARAPRGVIAGHALESDGEAHGALSAFRRLGARVVSANVAFDDHPNEKRFSDRIETVTVDSVFRWLERDGLGGAVEVIR